MLYSIAVILVILFLLNILGVVSFGLGNLVYGLLVLAIIAVLFQVISGRRSL